VCKSWLSDYKYSILCSLVVWLKPVHDIHRIRPAYIDTSNAQSLATCANLVGLPGSAPS
jgi:hypothetical protein